MAATRSSRMACPGAANNRMFIMGLLGRASSVSMANARCTLLLISSSSRSCRGSSSTSTSPLLSKKKKVRPNTNLSPWRSRLSAMGVMSPVDLKPLSGGTRTRVAFCRAGMDSAPEAVAEKKPFQEVVVPATFQQAIQRLQDYWTSVGCAVMQSSDTEVGAGIMNPATFLRVLRPEPWNVAYVEPSVRPHDSRYGENPNRVQKHSQFQVILKLDPGISQNLYLGSLAALGIDIKAHEVRFVEDNWESPVLGAWGLGREVWMDDMEITQFTYFQQAGSIPLVPVSVEITYDIEQILTSLQEDKGSEERAGKVLSLQPHDLEAFDNEGISSEVTCRRTSEQADSVRGSRLPRSNVGRAEEQAKVEELTKVVEVMRQSLVSVLDQLEALVRQKEITDGPSKSIHVREVMSDAAIASALTAVETIGSSLNGIRLECEDLKSPRSLMKFRKSVQQKEAKRSLNDNVGLKKQNLKLTDDTAAINGIREEDEKFMGEALVEAKKAAMAGEVPVGAVIVQKGKIIARAYNRVESDADPTAHAEMLCLRSAARQHGDWRLMDATVYVTLEPCPMCAGAILQSRVKRLVWGSRNTLLGADGSWVSLFPELVEEEIDSECQRSENGPGNRPSIHPFHASLEVRRQVLADECSTVMRSFFKARRTLKMHFLKTKPWWLPLSAWVLFKRMLTWWSS